jgi:hypothetical protein
MIKMLISVIIYIVVLEIKFRKYKLNYKNELYETTLYAVEMNEFPSRKIMNKMTFFNYSQ